MTADIQFVANLAEIFGGLAVILGIVFGFLEYRRYKSAERREAAASLARSFQTAEFANAIRVLMELPDPLSMDDFQALSEQHKNRVWLVFTSFESIGILVFRGDLPLNLVDDFFSIPVVNGWRKLTPVVQELRHIHGAQTWEWYEWLSRAVSKRHASQGRTPAHIRHGSD